MIEEMLTHLALMRRNKNKKVCYAMLDSIF
jgi:hypothetical protein